VVRLVPVPALLEESFAVKPSFRRTTLLCLSVSALVAACSSGKSSNGDDGLGSGNANGSDTGGGTSTGGTASSTGGTASSTGGTADSTGGTGTQAAGQGGSSTGAAGASAAAGLGGGGPVAGSSGTVGGSGGGSTTGTGGSNAAGSGGSSMATGGSPGASGSSAMAGAAGMLGSAGATTDGGLGSGMMMGMGESSDRYATEMVSRNGVPYILITNGWGPGFQSHTVSWNGTSFTVEAMMGTPGSSGQPASYPSVFCGQYSVMQVPACGLPKAIDQMKSLKTGWRWSANGNTNPYNAAYDIWLGTSTGFGMYLMVWLRDPPTQQPAGSLNSMFQGITVANVPGVWDIWNGTVNSRPIINFVRKEGSDSSEIEFDVLDFIHDAQNRGLTITGTQVNAVAVGFEIWQGPVTNLESQDFYVDVE
jgi:hypothetical protein